MLDPKNAIVAMALNIDLHNAEKNPPLSFFYIGFEEAVKFAVAHPELIKPIYDHLRQKDSENFPPEDQENYNLIASEIGEWLEGDKL